MNDPATSTAPECFGRYLVYPAIAHGGMATVHMARLVGAEGFSRLVAAKRLHPQFIDDPEFVTMFHDEACIASRVHHPNVVPVLDVVVAGRELILVQEYVHGVPLGTLMRVAQVDETPIPIDIAISVLAGVLAGLHAAHEVKDAAGQPLEIIHRDVSPGNVMISVDGVPRLLDFGIAKATTSTHHTREGIFKGKLAYMAPEQLRMDDVDRSVDVYAAGVLAWELLVNRRIYDGRSELAFATAAVSGELPPITAALADSRGSLDPARWEALVELQPIISRAMSPIRATRFATAEELMRALLEVRPAATTLAVAEWLHNAGAEFLDKRQKALDSNEESWRRAMLLTPRSGIHRVAHRSDVMSALPPPSTASDVPSAMPGPMVMGASDPPPGGSGAFVIAGGASPLAVLASKTRAAAFVPWLAAGAFLLLGLVGGVVGSNLVAVPTSASASSARGHVEAVQAAPVTDLTPPSVPVSSLPVAPASAAGPAFTPAPAMPPPTVLRRQVHVAPPSSAPVRPAAAARSPASPVSASPNAASSPSTPSGDCNPPFFFDGTKKIFKLRCL